MPEQIFQSITQMATAYGMWVGAAVGALLSGYGISKLRSVAYKSSRPILEGRILKAEFSNSRDSNLFIQTEDDLCTLVINTDFKRRRTHLRGEEYRRKAHKLETILKPGMDVKARVHDTAGTSRRVYGLLSASSYLGTVPLDNHLLDTYTIQQLEAMVPKYLDGVGTRYSLDKKALDARRSRRRDVVRRTANVPKENASTKPADDDWTVTIKHSPAVEELFAMRQVTVPPKELVVQKAPVVSDKSISTTASLPKTIIPEIEEITVEVAEHFVTAKVIDFAEAKKNVKDKQEQTKELENLFAPAERSLAEE